MLPTFLIIGTMKGGTSSLFTYLNEHPEICMSSEKEPNFFVKEKNLSKGIEWYKSLFKGDAKVIGEASTNYTKRHLFKGVPERIYSLMPTVKLIYLLRDPIDRLVSHYINNYAHGREGKKLENILANFNDNKYLLTSCYHYQISAYLPLFDRKNVLFITTEELLKEREKTLKKTLSFLNVNNNPDLIDFSKLHNKSSKKMRPSKLDLNVKNRVIKKILRPLLPDSYSSPTEVKKPEIGETNIEKLKNYFKEDIDKLRQLTGKEFSEWSV